MNDHSDRRELRTTHGVIALVNLEAQIASLEMRAAEERLWADQWADLSELLTLRGTALGRDADYERAAVLAEQLVSNASDAAIAYLARARTHATCHRFDAALADLDVAEKLGAGRAVVAAERAASLYALGRSAEAMALLRSAARRQPDFATLGALAGLHAECGENGKAERLFRAALRRYPGISPFPVAHLNVQRGRMWLVQGNVHAARARFDEALGRVPGYAPALASLAKMDSVLMGCIACSEVDRIQRNVSL